MQITRNIRQFVDIDFTFQKHPITSNLVLKKDLNAIKQSVVNLLLLQRGDKKFHPEIESPISKYLFENASPVLQFLIQDETRKYLNTYEPRVSISDIKVTFPDPNTIKADITGIIINSTEPFNITVLVDRLR